MTRLEKLPEQYQDQVKKKNRVGVSEKLIIYGELPSLNEIINAAKGHWNKYRKLKEELDDTVAWHAEQQRVKFFEAVKLDITYYCEDRRTDPDNILSAKKFILDGLVKAGVLEDDGWKQVKEINESWKLDKSNPRIVVYFEEGKG